ncbi:hypothetical protein CEXT_239051, partial [Caerostris extrusa]
ATHLWRALESARSTVRLEPLSDTSADEELSRESAGVPVQCQSRRAVIGRIVNTRIASLNNGLINSLGYVSVFQFA